MNILIGWLLIGVAIGIFLIGVLAALRRRSDAEPRPATCLMLVLLRLAIGWHFLIEGVDKLNNPAWTSAGYLREATGPLAPQFRELAGDAVVDMLTVTAEKELAPALDENWQNYVDAVVSFYGLDGPQSERVRAAVDALKKQTAQMLADRTKQVEMVAPYPPPFKEKLTIKERIAILDRLQDKVSEIETGRLPQYTTAAFEDWKKAKGNANRWRGDLQKDLDLINRNMKRTIGEALLDLTAEKLPAEKRAKVEAAVKKLHKLANADIYGANAKVFDRIKLQKGHTYVIGMESPDVDCYLRLEDGSGIVLAEDMGTGRKARMTYKVPDDRSPLTKEPNPKVDIPDSYRIVAGSYGKAAGTFTILCKDQAELPPQTKDDKKEPKKKFEIGTPWTDKIDANNKDALRKPADLTDWENIDKIDDRLEAKIAEEFRKTVDPKTDDPLTLLVLDNVLAKRKKDQPLDPLPYPVTRPWRQWTLLDWSDHIVKHGVLAVGVMLLVGLFTRLACLVGAGFLLMFFLAMPPLPGLPEGPRTEGHYLYVNKNLIEMLALLVLATTFSGRWLGLDGFVQFLNPWRWRRSAGPGNIKS